MAEIVAIDTSVLVVWHLDEGDSESASLLRDKRVNAVVQLAGLTLIFTKL